MKALTSTVLLFFALGGSTGCGASIQAIYEGDVRFERCMALDVRPESDVGARRACWTDWVAFYTYGQTRDRVLHARLRIRQLEGVEDGSASTGDGLLKAPGPTTALAPPPMME
jgi:hypothetical protein